MHNSTALLGATGLIGGHLLKLMQDDDHFTEIRVLTRRPLEIHHPKVKVQVIDFSDPEAFKQAIEGCETVFCSVGTTNKKVKGDKTAYRKVDYDIPVTAARCCAETGGKQFLLVSSVGADSHSRNFYLKLKGEVEDKISGMSIPSISIFRPSMLLGDRQESRPLETVAQVISKALSFLFPSKYKPIAAEDVARAMVNAAKQGEKGTNIYHYWEISNLTP